MSYDLDGHPVEPDYYEAEPMAATEDHPDGFSIDLTATVTGYSTLGDVVIAVAAEKLLANLGRDEAVSNLGDRIRAIRDEEIRFAVSPLVEQALSASLVRTNNYGEPVGGEPLTLRDVIVQEAKKVLTAPSPESRSGYGRSVETVLQKHIREVVEQTFVKQLNEELWMAKKQVREAVLAKASEALAKVAF